MTDVKGRSLLVGASFTDFDVDKLLWAVEVIEARPSDDEFSPVVCAMETLCTTMVADQNDWAACWCKLCHWVMNNEMKVPSSLKVLDLSVPRKFAYMLDAPGSGTTAKVKVEDGNADATATARPDPALGLLG